ncbi:MAG: alpha/beta hydrolase, partial [Bacteroidetes bacterium]
MTRIWLISFILLTAGSGTLRAQQDSLYLYPEGVPGAIPKDIPERWIVNPQDGVSLVTDVQRPMLYVHRPARPNGASVLICPGGGYFAIAMDHEGHQLARWFNERGITAFVLKYRLPNDELMRDKAMRPLQDAQQAMRIIRKNAASWQLDPKQVGIMGFSAGGHLAATAGTHFTKQVGEITDPALSVRPDFMILLYPVISFTLPISDEPSTSRENRLLGSDASPELLAEYSNEQHVSAETPPTFMLLATDDFISPKQDMAFYNELRRNNVPVEMHIYGQGGHGFSLTQKGRGHVEQWPTLMEGWLKDRGILKPMDAYERHSLAYGAGKSLPYRVLYPENYDSTR